MKDRPRPVGQTRRAERSGRRGEAARPAARASVWSHPALGAALGALLLYLPALGYGFVRDDHDLIEKNAFLHGSRWFAKLLASDFWASAGGSSGLWRPVVLVSYWLEGRLGHWQPWIFHASNAAAHAATSALVTLLVLQAGLPRIAALLAGLWFAAMPAHLESVAWIAGRTYILCGLFCGLALWADERACRRGGRWPGTGAVVAFALALLAKEAAASFVGVLVIADWCRRREASLVARLRWLAPYAAVLVAYLVAHHLSAAAVGAPRWLEAAAATRRRWAGWTMLPGFVAFLWPTYPHAPDLLLRLPKAAWAPGVVAGGVALGVAAIALAVAVARRSRVAVPGSLFLLPLVVPIGLAIGSGFIAYGERMLYVSSLGAAWLLGLAVTWAAAKPHPRSAGLVAIGAGLVLVGASAFETVRLLPTWRDDGSMFAATVRVQPDHAEARIGLAAALADQGREEEALEQLSAAERLEPRHPALHVERAVLRMQHGDWPGVLANARRALEFDPYRGEARLLEATALLRLRRLDEAQAVLAGLRERNPGDPAVESLWGQLLLVRGQVAEALPALERAARWIGDDAALSYALGVASLMAGRPDAARAALRRTAELDPGYYDCWLRLAWAEHLCGDAQGAMAALARARSLPESADGRADALERRLQLAPTPAPPPEAATPMPVP